MMKSANKSTIDTPTPRRYGKEEPEELREYSEHIELLKAERAEF